MSDALDETSNVNDQAPSAAEGDTGVDDGNQGNGDTTNASAAEDDDDDAAAAPERDPSSTVGTYTAASTTTFASNGGAPLTMDWTQMGVTADEALPLRYPHDVSDWSPDDVEICVVGTAGQKITALGDDFAPKSRLTNPKLEKLILRSHMIKTMDGLGHLTQLQLLELYDNMVQSLDEESLLGCGPSLKTLDMSFNAIRDMEPVRLCTGNLTELFLANNKLKTIVGLKNLVHLRKIDLGANRIRVIDGDELSGLINLEELWVGKNKIEEITGLEKVSDNVRVFRN